MQSFQSTDSSLQLGMRVALFWSRDEKGMTGV